MGSTSLIIGISIGVAVGVLLVGCIILCYKMQKNRAQTQSGSDRRGLALPIRVNGVDSSVILSDFHAGHESVPPVKEPGILSAWWGGAERRSVLTHSGVPRYSYRDLHKATDNFTTRLGEGAFGPVYKAVMSTGETFAVKVLSSHSKQGEREFLTEVMLLGRLHHRNLVNLVGYCAEKGHRILVYEFMEHGSLAGYLYGQEREPLPWELRVQIAQEISRGIEYLHDGATPPVIHRDIKSANILLDSSMRARVADFGLSKELNTDSTTSGVRGTFGYVDPEYISTNQFTEKSDVFSFGVLLFELITARNPQQGLMEYVHLAAMSVEGREGWEEILDSRLNGRCNVEELGAMASLAKNCVSELGRSRPRMREVAQTLTLLGKRRNSFQYNKQSTPNGTTHEAKDIELPRAEWKRLGSIAEHPEV